MNGYIAYWNGRQLEVYAKTSLAAQNKACKQFQAKTRKKIKPWDITVMHAEYPDGSPVIHSTASL